MFDVLGKRPRFSFEKGRGEDSDATFRSFHQAQRYNKKKSEILTQLKQMANGQTEKHGSLSSLKLYLLVHSTIS